MPRTRLRYRCSFDSRRLHGCGARYSQRLAVGRHVLRAQTVDRAGNRSGVRSVTVVVGSSQGSRLPSLHALNVVKQWYVDAAAGNDATGNGSSTRPWRTVQRAADYLRSTAAWPSSGDVAVNLRPTGTYKSTTDPSATLSLDFTSAARAPRAKRWLIWRRDPAYGGRAVIANPDGSDADKYGVVVSNTPYDNYMVFDGIRFTGESVPKGRAGSNGASTGVYLEGNNNHHFEFRNFEFDGFRQTNAASFESVEGVFQSGTSGPLSFVNGVFHDIATPGSGGAGGHGVYLHGESGILLLNVLAFKMNHGFAFQFYNSHGGVPGNGAIISHCTIVDNGFGANGGTIILPEAASNVKIVNSIIAYNGSAAAIHFYPIGSGSGNNGDHLLFYSNSGGNHDYSSGWTWTNERTADPHVLHGGKSNFRLRQGSPALGYSNTAYSPAKDLNGNPRPPGGEDAGAFQFVPR
jgi:hypothetical protein